MAWSFFVMITSAAFGLHLRAVHAAAVVQAGEPKAFRSGSSRGPKPETPLEPPKPGIRAVQGFEDLPRFIGSCRVMRASCRAAIGFRLRGSTMKRLLLGKTRNYCTKPGREPLNPSLVISIAISRSWVFFSGSISTSISSQRLSGSPAAGSDGFRQREKLKPSHCPAPLTLHS